VFDRERGVEELRRLLVDRPVEPVGRLRPRRDPLRVEVGERLHLGPDLLDAPRIARRRLRRGVEVRRRRQFRRVVSRRGVEDRPDQREAVDPVHGRGRSPRRLQHAETDLDRVRESEGVLRQPRLAEPALDVPLVEFDRRDDELVRAREPASALEQPLFVADAKRQPVRNLVVACARSFHIEVDGPSVRSLQGPPPNRCRSRNG